MATFGEERETNTSVSFLGFPLSELPTLKHLRKHPEEFC